MCLPENVAHFRPKEIGNGKVQSSAHVAFKESPRLFYKVLVASRQHPFGSHAGIEDIGIHLARSSRSISSAEGNGPPTGDSRSWIARICCTIRFRRLISASVGTLSASNSRTSAAI